MGLVSMVDNLKMIAEDICRWSSSDRSQLPNKLNFLQKQLLHLYMLERTFSSPVLEGENVKLSPVKTEYSIVRKEVEKNLPELGYYHKVLNPLNTSESVEVGVADAVDDLTDIIQDLLEFIWWEDNSSETEAIWHFKHNFKMHTCDHLIGLITYLSVNINDC